jgi:hypothetical protein
VNGTETETVTGGGVAIVKELVTMTVVVEMTHVPEAVDAPATSVDGREAGPE